MLLCNIEDMEMGGMVRYRVKVNKYETKPGIGGGLVGKGETWKVVK